MKFFLISLIVFSQYVAFAQQDSTYVRIYKTNHKVEIIVPAAFFVGAFFGFKALDRNGSMYEADVLKLDPQSINSFDRPVAYFNPVNFQSAESASDLLLNVSVASPAFLLFDKEIRRDWADFISLFLVAHAIDNAIYFASVPSVRRPRPLVFNPEVPLEEKIGEGKANSFFSGHTSWSSTSTFLMAKIYTDYHHIKGWKRIAIFTGAAIPPSLVGYYRMEAGKHFRTDVLTGLILGAVCGITIPELHRIKDKSGAMSFRPFNLNGASGVTVSYLIK